MAFFNTIDNNLLSQLTTMRSAPPHPLTLPRDGPYKLNLTVPLSQIKGKLIDIVEELFIVGNR
jgi:hypothetical protein